MGKKKSKFYTRLTLETRFYDNTKQTYVVERNYWDPTLDDMLDMMESLLKAALYDPQSVEEVFHDSCEPPPSTGCCETDDCWCVDKPEDSGELVGVEDPQDWALPWQEPVPEKQIPETGKKAYAMKSWECMGCTEACDDTACLLAEDY